MSLPKGAYQALEDALGAENISDDPAITTSYSYMWLLHSTHAQSGRYRPAAVALPESTEDIQTIIRIANRYGFNYIPVGTNLLPPTIPVRPDTVIIDPKRMGRILEIDEKNMYAVVEPYVSYSQLQGETHKIGLTLTTPEAGSQVSVLANNMFQGMGGTGHKFGFNRGILGLDWILPTGDLLQIGSRGVNGGGYFWGDCAGLNLKGLVRADTGHCGGLGMVTTMAVKLFPYPGPRIYPCTGANPNLSVAFPEDRFKIFMTKFKTKQKLADAMYDIGHSEIGASVHEEGANWVLATESPSVEHFWKKWPKFQHEWKNILVVVLAGFSSTRQLEYEEKVYKDIIKDHGGKPVSDELYKIGYNLIGEAFRCGMSNRLYRPAGDFFVMGGFGFDSIDHSLKTSEEIFWPIIEDAYKKGHFIEDLSRSDWVNSYQMGHYSEVEPIIYFEHDLEAGATFLNGYVGGIVEAVKKKMMPTWPLGPMTYLTGPAMCNYHELVLDIKKVLDPRMTSNPGYPLPPESPFPPPEE